MGLNETPRRNIEERQIDAEKAILNAVSEVEKLGADVRLTDVVVTLGKAKDLLGDYVDSTLTLP